MYAEGGKRSKLIFLVANQFMRHLPVAHLLHSFNVSNKYVLLKLRLIIFPWRHVSTYLEVSQA